MSKETAAGGANGGKDGEHGHMGNVIGGMVSDVDGRLYRSNEKDVLVGGDNASTVHANHASDDDESDVTNLARGDALIRLSTGQVSGSVDKV